MTAPWRTLGSGPLAARSFRLLCAGQFTIMPSLLDEERPGTHAEYGGKAGYGGRELRLRGTAAAGVPAPIRR